MNIGKPSAIEAEWLAKLGLGGLEDFSVSDEAYQMHLMTLKLQHGTKRPGHDIHPEETLRARALARAASEKYSRPTKSEPQMSHASTPMPSSISPKGKKSYDRIIIITLLVILILLVLAILTGRAQASKANAGQPSRANMWFWNGSAYVPVEGAAPLPITCNNCSGSGASATDNSSFGIGTAPVAPLGAYYTSGADPAISTGNIGRARMDSHSYLFTDCVIGCSGGATTPTDAFANPTTASLNFSFLAGYNGATWDRLRVDGSKNLLIGVNVALPTGSNTIGAVTQASGPWTFNLTQVAGQTLGAIANYGTSPGAVLVPGVNAFVTNVAHTICDSGCGAGGSTTPSDAFANPSTAVLGFNLLAGFNGTTWDRLRVDASKNLLVACATCGLTDNSAFTVGTTGVNVMGAYYTSGSAPTLSTGNAGRVRMDANSYLFTDCVVGCSGGATTPADAFTNPTTAGLQDSFLAAWNGSTWDRLRTMGAGQNVASTGIPGNYCGFNTSPTTITSGNFSPVQCDSTGHLLVAGTFTAGVIQVKDASNVSTNVGYNTGNLNVPVQGVETGATAAAVSTWAALVGGTDGTNLRAFFVGDVNNVAAATGFVAAGTIGRYNATQPTLTDTRFSMAQLSSRGELLIAKGVSGFSIDNTTFAATQSGTWNIATLTSITNQVDVNVKQFNGVTPLMGNGVTGTGSPRVTIASDNTAFSVNATLSAETTKVIGTVRNLGNAGAVLDAAGQNVATPANWFSMGCTFFTSPTTITNGNGSPLGCDNTGALRVAGSFSAGVVQVKDASNVSTNVGYNTGNLNMPVQGVETGATAAAVSTWAALVGGTDGTNLRAFLVDSSGRQFMNIAQINAVTPLMGNGVTGTGSQRVTIASDNTAFSVNATLSAETTKVIGTIRATGNVGGVLDAIGQNVTAPANWMSMGCNFYTSPTTVTDGKGSPCQMDNAGNIRINIAAQTLGKVLVTPDSVALPANQSVNISQINAVTPLMGNGVTGTGSLRVTIASDNTSNSNAWLVAGGKTNNNAAPGATNVGTLGCLANAATQTWTEADLVTCSVDLSGRERIMGTLSDNVAAAGATRLGILPSIYQTSYLNGTAATQGRDAALSQGTDGLLWVAALPSIRPASFHASAAYAGSSTTDNFRMPGNATNTVLVTKLITSCTQTTAGVVTLTVNKRSTAGSGGTAANATVVPDDSNYSAGVSVPQSYTGTGPTVGTIVGQIDAYKLGCNATGTAGPNDIYILNLRQKPIVLRGTAENLVVNMGGAITGGNLTTTVEWIETATITP